MRYCLSAILCIFLFRALPAYAEVRDFNYYSIDIPPGWTVIEDGNAAVFTSKDKSASMMVSVDYMYGTTWEGMTARELAEAYSTEMHGTPPTMEDNDQNYFSFGFKTPSGVESEASVVVSGRIFYLITVSGAHKELARMVESVLLSIL